MQTGKKGEYHSLTLMPRGNKSVPKSAHNSLCLIKMGMNLTKAFPTLIVVYLKGCKIVLIVEEYSLSCSY